MKVKIKNLILFKCLVFLNFLFIVTECSGVIRPRGVPLTKKIFYDPSKNFTCIDGSLTIPFHHVNDDYCDCLDSSDEPGTSACPNGSFYCPNVGFIEKEIYSSFVNDGICDCCDGSDEWRSEAKCVNNCFELAEISREAYRKQQEIIKQGNEIRNQYIKEANQKKLSVDQDIARLKEDLKKLEEEKQEKLALKQETDTLEKQALDKHAELVRELEKQNEENEASAVRNEERRLATSVFKELDINEDGSLTYTEMMSNIKFDQNGDGIVTEDEAKIFLNSKDSNNLEEFLISSWSNVKPFYFNLLKPQELEHDQQNIPETNQDQNFEKESNDFKVEEHVSDSEVESDSNSEVESDSDEDANEKNEETEKDENDEYLEENINQNKDYSTPETKEQPVLEYNEETKQIIEKAKENREQYNSIEQKVSVVQHKVNDLEKIIRQDYGLEDEFLLLQGQCFEHTDREYTYKLCLFDKATQRPKEGNEEVFLGRWFNWTGVENKKYSSFRYDGGSTCWNGPPRSVDVKLSCGVENKLVSVSEPNRCEYLFEFETPASCDSNSKIEPTYEHTEL